MRPRTTVFLAAVLAALCAGYWLMLAREQHHTEQVAASKRLFDFEPNAVRSLTIQRQGEQATIGMRENGGDWNITEPYPVRPNRAVWERAAKALAELSNERTVTEDAGSLDQYGLADPVTTVRAQTADGREVQLEFGSLDPTQKFRYARSGKGPVFLIDPDAFFELDRSLLWLRDRYLITGGADGKTPVDRIEFARIRAPESAAGPADTAQGPAKPSGRDTETWEESVAVVVERDADGRWRITLPVEGVADQEMVESLANELQYATGRDYVDQPESLTDYGLDPPKARLTVRCGASGASQTVFLGMFAREGKEGGLYVKKEGAPGVFVIDAQVISLLPNKIDAFQEKRLLTHKAADIRRLVYTATTETFTLENPEGGGWKLVNPPTADTDQAAVSRFVGNLVSARGSEYFSERKPEFGLDSPALRIALTYAGSDTPAEILVGQATSSNARYYVTQDTGAITTLTKQEVDAMRATPLDFVSKGLLSFTKDKAAQILMSFDGVNYVFQKGEQAWFISEPKRKAWESRDDMDALLDAFSNCNAERIEAPTAPNDRVPYGLLHPILTVRVTLKAEGQGGATLLGPLEIGDLCKDNPHQRYATIAGRSELFRVNQTIVEAVRGSLRGLKNAPPPDQPRKPEVKVRP